MWSISSAVSLQLFNCLLNALFFFSSIVLVLMQVSIKIGQYENMFIADEFN